MENNNKGEVRNSIQTQEKKPEEKNGVLKWAIVGGICLLLITGMLSKVYEFGMNVLYSLVYGEDAEFYGATERITFGKEESDKDSDKYNSSTRVELDENNQFTVYPAEEGMKPYIVTATEWLDGKSSYMIDNYVVEIEGISVTELYSYIDADYYGYINGTPDFWNLTGYGVTTSINNLMRENSSTPIKVEGQIISIDGEGNVITIADSNVSNNYDIELFTGMIDMSFIDNKDDFYINDTVTIYGRYCGKIPMQSGSYEPLIIAVAVELQ